MDPVQIETSITLSRTAEGAVTFARAVERYADKTYTVYGGARSLDDGSGAWAPEANVTRTNPAGLFDSSMIKLAVADAFTNGIVASLDKWSADPLDLSGDSGINILIKPSIDIAAGVLQIAVAEDDAIATPVLMDLPAMVAGKWHYFSLPYSGVASDRDAVKSMGLYFDSDPGAAVDLYVQSIRSSARSYGMAGFLNDDQAVEGDVSKQYQTSLILAAGNINAKLASGITVVSEQPLYAVPGSGELHTLEIVSDNRPITATEDQATAGERVGVRF